MLSFFFVGRATNVKEQMAKGTHDWDFPFDLKRGRVSYD